MYPWLTLLLQSLVQGSARAGERLPATLTFLIGAAAGTITVYCESSRAHC